MMAVVNIGAILEYGRADAVLRRVAGIAKENVPNASTSPVMTNGADKVKLMVARKLEASSTDDKRMDVDDDDALAGSVGVQLSPAMSDALPSLWRCICSSRKQQRS